MAEQGNVGGPGGAMSPHNMSIQGQNYNMGPQGMAGMDVMNMGQMPMGGMGNQSQRHAALDGSGDSVDNLAPIFPPQNFEVPDISFSNSVSPNAEFNQTLLSSAQMLGSTSTLYTSGSTPSHVMAAHPMNSQAHMGMSGQGQQMGMSGQQQGMSYFPPASNSPPGTSSSEDSDDLPLAQLAKRAAAGPSGSNSSNSATTAAASSPSAPSAEPASAENSPTSGTGAKKAKPSKRKKKKDPNEPQKPVSAYALFFRDTQATIKGHNPSASFGEVSKIVASMWDQLDPEHKDVYKKKTEMAKKQYLKQLAAYRASQVSQSAAEEAEKSPSPPGVNVAPPGMGNTSVGVMPVTTNFPPMGVGPPPGPIMTTSHMPVTMSSQMMGQQRPQQMQQHSPPHMMQMSPQMMQQQQQQQHHMQQMQQQMHHQQMQQHQQMNMGQQASPSPPSQQQQQHSPAQQQQQSPPPATAYNSPPHMGQGGPSGYQTSMVEQGNLFGFSDTGMELDITYPQCVRSGCGNHARENPAWDSEYCSNDCVITHCRDIFTNWVAARSGTNTFPVK